MIQIEGLRKRLGGQWVLDGIDLDVQPGEVLAVMGPSGTGKSVLLKHIIGLLAPDGGEVYVAGEPVGRATARELAVLRRRMGYVFQDAALLDSLTIRENLLLALDDGLLRRDPRAGARRVADTLALVNLDARVLDKHPSEVSGGMRKRVGVARAIINAPDIVLYDEPTTGLDPQNVSAIAQLVLRAREQLGATSLVVTHDLAFLEAVADRVVLLADGRVRFDGSVSEFLGSTNSLVTRFLGRTNVAALTEAA